MLEGCVGVCKSKCYNAGFSLFKSSRVSIAKVSRSVSATLILPAFVGVVIMNVRQNKNEEGISHYLLFLEFLPNTNKGDG